MKKVIGILMTVFFAVGMIGICLAAEPGPVVVMGTPLVKMDGKAPGDVVIMGTGFKPGQEINVLFIASDRPQTNIGYALDPTPTPDQTGSWFTTWNANRFVDKEVVDPKGGAYKIMVSDSEYIPIAHTTVFFQAVKEEQKKK